MPLLTINLSNLGRCLYIKQQLANGRSDKMSGVQAIVDIVARQAYQTAAAATIACATDNGYDGRIGIRVSAIFVILIGSLFGKRGSRWPEVLSGILIVGHRCRFSCLRCTTPRYRGAGMGILHSEILRVWCHHRHSIHPCTQTNQPSSYRHPLTRPSYSPLPAMRSQTPASQAQ